MANASGFSYRKATEMAISQHKRDGGLAGGVSSQYESELRNQMLETHDHHQLAILPLKPILNIVEVVLRRAIGEFPGLVQVLKAL